MVSFRVKVYTTQLMDLAILENGKMICNMVTEKKHGKISHILLVNMLMGKKMEKELIIMLMAQFMKVIGLIIR